MDSHVAIIGMSCRFPGARNLEEFWANLIGGVESITRFSDRDLTEAGISAATLARPDYVKAAPVLDDPSLFDAAFFGFSPAEAATMDPQHRLLLELSYAALEDAGCDTKRFPGRTGVFAGSAMNTYFMNRGLDARFSEDYIPTLTFNDKDFLATRLSYKLGLCGPGITVQTACSTSLVAIHLARQSLLNGETDMALAGAVSVRVPHRAGYFYDGGGVVSPDGHVRAFDAGANGTVFGSGGGVIIMKRLEDALAQGDQIYAVIRGSAVNNDGSAKAGYTAPSVDGQADVIVEALANADVDAESISYVEAHGSGTPVGDPVEVFALTKAFRNFTERTGYCAIGSVKTNVGHLDAAAGMAGIIKTAMALKRRRIPPTLHYSKSNPEINFPATPFYVNTQALDWNRGDEPRRAGVMATGMGGTNAHVILEEAPASATAKDSGESQLLILSAKTSTALDTMSGNLADFLSSGQAGSSSLADAAHTLQTGRRQFSCRRFAVCRNTEEATAAFKKPDAQTRIPPKEMSSRPVVFLMPGVGDHYVGMGRGLYENFEVFRQEVDGCAQILQPLLGVDIREIMFPPGHSSRKLPDSRGIDLKRMLGRGTDTAPDAAAQKLDQTIYCQPALFCLEYGLARLWMQWGVQPDRIVGHSMGEYVAACLSEVFSLNDALRLVATRAKLANELPQGSMLAVMLPEKELLPMLSGQLSISLINSPNLCVVSGPVSKVTDFQSRLTEQEVVFRPVRNAHAFHSRMLDPIVDPFVQEIKQVRLQAPRIPFTSNITGTWITPEQACDPSYWADQARYTARFSTALEQLWNIPGALPLEIGPGRTLGVLAMQHPARNAVEGPQVFSSLRHDYENEPDPDFILNNAGKLWLAGVEMDWEKLDSRPERRKISLPPYPFERQRYWIESSPGDSATVAPKGPRKTDLTDWFYIPVWERTVFRTGVQGDTSDDSSWLVIGERSDFASRFVSNLNQRGANVVCAYFGTTFATKNSDTFEIGSDCPDDYMHLLGILKKNLRKSLNIVHLGPLSAGTTSLDSSYDPASQNFGFYSLLNLAKAIGEQEISAQVRIGAVTCQIHEVTGEEKLNPTMATVLGACGVMPKEYSNVTSFSVDLPAAPSAIQNPDEIVSHLLGEFRQPEKSAVIAYRGNYRWQRSFQPKKLSALPAQSAAKEISAQGLRPRGVYLITGGTGGIGLAMAKYLAQTCQARLVLTKKTPFPQKSTWRQQHLAGTLSDSDKRTVSALLELEALGGEVDVFTCDVADQAGMNRLVDEACRKHKTIHGVIHAAGVIGVGLMQVKTREAADKVLSPKVSGSLVLAEALKNVKLDFLGLVSSLSSVTMPFAHADYCAAHAFMDAFGYYFQAKRNCRVLNINWPIWREVGILADMKAQLGVEDWRDEALQKGILTRDGIEVLKRAFLANVPQLAVCPEELGVVIEQSRAVSSPSKPVATGTGPVSAKSLVSRGNLEIEEPRSERERTVAGIWSEVLGISPIGIQENFFDLGGHSLLAMQIVSRIRNVCGVSFSLRYFFISPTIRDVASQINALAGSKEPEPERGNKPATADANATSTNDAAPRAAKDRKPELIRVCAGNSKLDLFFLIDEGSLGLLKLAHSMDKNLSLFASLVPLPEAALKASAKKQISLLPRLEDLAAEHAALILNERTDRPVLLVGHCFGGLLAFETAHQLQRAGRQVDAVMMIDTWMTEPGFWWLKKTWLTAHVHNVLQQGATYLWRKSLRRINLEKDELASRLNLATHGDFDVHVPWTIIERIYRHAMDSYRPHKLTGRGILFVSREDWLSNAYRELDNSLGTDAWFSGDVEVVDVPGDHVTVLDESHLAELAQCCEKVFKKLSSKQPQPCI